MSENIGAWIREQRFGHIVAQTGIGEVFSLDLFETPDLVCQGFYLPVPNFLRQDVLGVSQRPPASLLPEIELRALSVAMQELERSSEIVRRGESPDSDDLRGFQAFGPGFEADGAINLVSRQQGAEVWTGRVEGSPGEMSFVLERYGSPEIILLIVAIYLLIHMDRRADELDEECRRAAIEICGERRIKRYRARRTLLSFEPEGFSHDCDIECQ